MKNNEKIRDLLKLLNMNQDHLCYELTSLAAKINNFLDDSNRTLSGQLLSVMYDSLMEENASESVEINIGNFIETEVNETLEIEAGEIVEKDAEELLDRTGLAFDESRFALV